MKWSYIERARRILAREQGAIVKDWGGKLPIVLVYPNTYRVGMSSLGFHTVYRLFNAQTNVVCERAFWQPPSGAERPPISAMDVSPHLWDDLRRFAPDDPVASIETQRSIADFGVIAFSISFEMDYPHLVQVLRQARVPLRADERDEEWPLVIAGGPAVSANPLPVADFVDAVVIGEAEEVIDPLIDVLWEGLPESREMLWQALAQVPGVYVPHLSPGNPQPVQRQWVRNLDDHPTSTVVHTPDTEFGGIHLIEVARGCGRGCRFCMAGFTARPKREHSVDSILEQAKRRRSSHRCGDSPSATKRSHKRLMGGRSAPDGGLAWRDRIGLVGAAVSDYTQIDALAVRLRELGARLSVSSLRVDPLSEPLLQALAESGTRTLTLAPEAGSERLRQIINKGVTEADLLYAAERAAHHRFGQLKLYFMLGLPTETNEDVDAIARLCESVATRFHGRVTANVTPFVPKAHTPFQWMAMTPSEVVEARLRALGKRLRRQGIAVKSESPRWSAMQGMLARGDRQLGAVLASLQGTSLKAWRRAMDTCGVDAADYVRARTLDEPLPWAFIHTGVNARFLQREWKRARKGVSTDPCPPTECAQCGVCPET